MNRLASTNILVPSEEELPKCNKYKHFVLKIFSFLLSAIFQVVKVIVLLLTLVKDEVFGMFKMGLPRIQSCCWVLDLKTGNIVLGCLNAFLSFIMVVLMIVAAVSVSSDEDAELLKGDLDIEDEAYLTGLHAMSIILVFMFLAKFLFDLLFVYGVTSERASIIKAYFIMWVVFFLLSVFTFSINAPYYGTMTILTELFYIGLNVYAILLCHSFYKQLNEREEV